MKKIRRFSLFTIFLAGLGSLVSMAQSAPRVQLSGIAHVAYRVSDPERAAAFLAKLGYEQAFVSNTKDGKISQIFVKVNDRQFIELYARTDAAQPLGWMHACYESEDLPAAVAAYAAQGLAPSPVHKAGAGNLITSFKDPEGRVTELTQYMPGSRHMLDHGKHLGANRVSDGIEGIAFPVPDFAAARSFYADGMGLAVAAEGKNLRVQLTAETAPWLRLEPAGAKPQLLFRVTSLKAAEARLRASSLAYTKGKNALSVVDSDGNTFTFVLR